MNAINEEIGTGPSNANGGVVQKGPTTYKPVQPYKFSPKQNKSKNPKFDFQHQEVKNQKNVNIYP